MKEYYEKKIKKNYLPYQLIWQELFVWSIKRYKTVKNALL